LDVLPVVKPIEVHGLSIGGWLILVVIGLVVTPIRIGIILVTTHIPIFRDGSWALLTSPGATAYHPYWAPILVFEIIGNLLSMVLAFVTLVHLFRRSKRTPKLAISWYAWGVALVLIDTLAGNLIPAVAAHSDPDEVKEIARSIFAALIWIPYFLVSKRVKATFVY
jgi:uncharacterized membrane protein